MFPNRLFRKIPLLFFSNLKHKKCYTKRKAEGCVGVVIFILGTTIFIGGLASLIILEEIELKRRNNSPKKEVGSLVINEETGSVYRLLEEEPDMSSLHPRMKQMISLLQKIAGGSGQKNIKGSWTDWTVKGVDVQLSISSIGNNGYSCIFFERGNNLLTVWVRDGKFVSVKNENQYLTSSITSFFSTCFFDALEVHVFGKEREENEKKVLQAETEKTNKALLVDLNNVVYLPKEIRTKKKGVLGKEAPKALHSFVDIFANTELEPTLQELTSHIAYIEDHLSYLDIEQKHHYVRLRDTTIPALLEAYLAFTAEEKKERQVDLVRSIKLANEEFMQCITLIRRTKKQTFDKQRLLIKS